MDYCSSTADRTSLTLRYTDEESGTVTHIVGRRIKEVFDFAVHWTYRFAADQ